MPGLLFDSDTPSVLFSPACEGSRIATYADLVTPAMLTEAGSRLIVIDRGRGDHLGVATVADIEPGCHTPASGAALIRAWAHEGRPFPTAYHDRAVAAEVTAALSGVRYWTWDATLDGTLRVPGVNAAAVQFAGEATLGFHADCSFVWDDSWHPQAAVVAPAVIAAVRHAVGVIGVAVGDLDHAVAGLLHALCPSCVRL